MYIDDECPHIAVVLNENGKYQISINANYDEICDILDVMCLDADFECIAKQQLQARDMDNGNFVN